MTCREKCRKCDRGRPSCQRCISKGLVCRGYPDQFRFCGIASRGKWKDARIPATAKDAPDQTQAQVQTPAEESPNSVEERLNTITSAASTPPMPEPRKSKRLTIDAMLVDSVPVEEDITTLLQSSQTKTLIHHCKDAK